MYSYCMVAKNLTVLMFADVILSPCCSNFYFFASHRVHDLKCSIDPLFIVIGPVDAEY